MTARGSFVLAVTATLAGVVIGLIGGAFRWCLQHAETLRLGLVEWAHRLPGPGWLIPVAAAALGAWLAALIVRRQPLAAGSGIQHVEAVYHGHARLPLIGLLFAKFVGGVLSIGSGLVLGREGPTVHMGAAVGAQAGRHARLSDADVRLMQTAVGGAGLAVAFNAPIAGVLFAVEEVSKSFRMQLVLATTLASATAVGCTRLILGNHPDFAVEPLAAPALGWLPLFLIFGLLTGLLGAAYNVTVLWFLDHVATVVRIPTTVKAPLIGALIGLAAVLLPLSVGDGQTITQLVLSGHTLALTAIVGYLAVRFIAGPLSYSAALPGGLFAPLLAIGALWGVGFVTIVDAIWPHDLSGLAIPMAIVGMASFFSATVRAPVTGMVIVIEMTATTSVTVPMLAATAAAVIAAQLTGSAPIYDSLRDRMVPERGPSDSAD
ncbi:ClC family H(+)/Cl(-) exchange transporter [Mycolicibacterium obuense]|uniref:H(+)/Cl(-) exchange transporter ClcA n=1 Tax=Mycolicibacterium obuense TaxID=1807 RepID=A0A0J6W4D8_9MYCO|nr:ClC family H(+)/Cl(-) exchange transporter [Mycolicibacterium obuense]KMO77324.1 H(+)/Cl(-) exchange transporter ClcA [Mycolicibacterium obuense]